MLVHKMHTALMRVSTYFVATLNEACICFVSSILSGSNKRVMVLRNVQGKEMVSGKILAALMASVHMTLIVVDLILIISMKIQRVMRRKRATHHCLGLHAWCVEMGVLLRLLRSLSRRRKSGAWRIASRLICRRRLRV